MRFETEDDFDLDKIAGSGQCFRWTREADGGYRIIASGRILHIRKEGVNSGRTGSGGTQEGTYGRRNAQRSAWRNARRSVRRNV